MLSLHYLTLCLSPLFSSSSPYVKFFIFTTSPLSPSNLFPQPLLCLTLTPYTPSFTNALHQGTSQGTTHEHKWRTCLLGGALGNFEANVLAARLHVEAEELFQGGCLDDLEALLAAKGRGFPVPGAADGVSQEPLHTPWTAHIDHGERGDGGT